jgi:translation initiation factor 1 (eIF-1/SUI1)
MTNKENAKKIKKNNKNKLRTNKSITKFMAKRIQIQRNQIYDLSIHMMNVGFESKSMQG